MMAAILIIITLSMVYAQDPTPSPRKECAKWISNNYEEFSTSDILDGLAYSAQNPLSHCKRFPGFKNKDPNRPYLSLHCLITSGLPQSLLGSIDCTDPNMKCYFTIHFDPPKPNNPPSNVTYTFTRVQCENARGTQKEIVFSHLDADFDRAPEAIDFFAANSYQYPPPGPSSNQPPPRRRQDDPEEEGISLPDVGPILVPIFDAFLQIIRWVAPLPRAALPSEVRSSLDDCSLIHQYYNHFYIHKNMEHMHIMEDQHLLLDHVPHMMKAANLQMNQNLKNQRNQRNLGIDL